MAMSPPPLPSDEGPALQPAIQEPVVARRGYRFDKMTIRFLGTSIPMLALGLSIAYMMS